MKKFGLVAMLLVLAGCGLAGPEERETVSYAVQGKVAALRVASDAGDVEISESDTPAVRVTETRVWRGVQPGATHDTAGDTLTLTYTCPKINSGCAVGYRVEIPHGLRVSVTVGAGSVTLRALSGTVEAKSGAGEISARDLTSKQVTATTVADDLSLAFAAAPDAVNAQSTSGDARVRLPQGPYKITVVGLAGTGNIAVPNDPTSPRTVQVTATAGNVEILPV